MLLKDRLRDVNSLQRPVSRRKWFEKRIRKFEEKKKKEREGMETDFTRYLCELITGQRQLLEPTCKKWEGCSKVHLRFREM